ncbi:hypothetical protein BU14_0176s0012 [Porphyra umbilicalis]|uniref:Uncharacterized protein n=1 Tax=Porphyra umbilicalis TaxID=2786 RepID=A0A1X6P7P1_PORUM|nr:hypothetical protein BU14_0176s0012 [Porphyra umbilicalis]|eukprot:OSX76770.1 hypothetical protein BU14_0176s0012 [Porphyra umbilicalis]
MCRPAPLTHPHYGVRAANPFGSHPTVLRGGCCRHFHCSNGRARRCGVRVHGGGGGTGTGTGGGRVYPPPSHYRRAAARSDGRTPPPTPSPASEPPPAPRLWVGVPTGPLYAVLAATLATWASARTFPLTFAPLPPFVEMPVVEVSATAPQPTGGAGAADEGVEDGNRPRPAGVPDVDALTPAVVALVSHITGAAAGDGSSGSVGGATPPPCDPDEATAAARRLLRALTPPGVARCLGCRTTSTTLPGALPPAAGDLVAAAGVPHAPPPPPAGAAAAAATTAAPPRRASPPPGGR